MKKLIALFLALILCATLTGCGASEGSKNYTKHTGFIEVDGHDNLYYDPATRVVYILFNEATGYTGYGYMSPYYADNGLPYLYDPTASSGAWGDGIDLAYSYEEISSQEFDAAFTKAIDEFKQTILSVGSLNASPNGASLDCAQQRKT